MSKDKECKRLYIAISGENKKNILRGLQLALEIGGFFNENNKISAVPPQPKEDRITPIEVNHYFTDEEGIPYVADIEEHLQTLHKPTTPEKKKTPEEEGDTRLYLALSGENKEEILRNLQIALNEDGFFDEDNMNGSIITGERKEDFIMVDYGFTEEKGTPYLFTIAKSLQELNHPKH